MSKDTSTKPNIIPSEIPGSHDKPLTTGVRDDDEDDDRLFFTIVIKEGGKHSIHPT